MNNTTPTPQQNTTISQLDKANEVLKGLEVTTEDRKEAQKKLKYSRFTIGGYLKGEGRDLDICMKLIEFFRKRIDDRELKLRGVAQLR